MHQLTFSVADRIVDFLVSRGVTTFFGIPGGPVSPVFDSILRSPTARLIESRHETAAAFAAACYHEETGKIAAIVVTAGPGGTNAVTGVTSAHLKKIPLLVICGDVAWADKGERLVQDCGPNGINMESVYRSITRKTIRIDQAQSACAQIALAWNDCIRSENPGPVLIMLPMHIARSTSTENTPELVERKSIAFQITSIPQVRQLLDEAAKPLIVVGNGCRKIISTVRELIDQTGIPFVTTPQAKGLISEHHPLSLRNGGLAASQWARKYVNEGDDIDVCLALGTDLDDCATGPTSYVKQKTKLIHIDTDPSVFNRNYRTFLPIQTDISSFLEQLHALLSKQPIRNHTWKCMVDEIKNQSAYDKPAFADDPSETIAPHRAIADIRRVMPAGTRYITDIGEHMLFALHYLTIDDTDSFHLHLNLGSMGSGIAGAIGLALGDPSKPVVCICGDGGMQMIGMEILVAKKLNLPIVYAVFNDHRYNMVYHGFRTLYGYTHPWDTPNVDFAKWASSMNIDSYCIKHPGELTHDMILESLKQSQPVVLDIRIDGEVRISGAGRNEHLQYMSVKTRILTEEAN